MAAILQFPKRPVAETFTPLGQASNQMLANVRRKMDERIAEEERLWRGYCEFGRDWLFANTEPA